MNHLNDDHYHQWLRERRSHQAPDCFTDDVMRVITADPTSTKLVGPLPRSEALAFWAKAALLALAVAVGVVRYAVLVLCLLFN